MSIGYNPFDEDFSIEEFQEYRTMAYSLREENLRLKKKVKELERLLSERQNELWDLIDSGEKVIECHGLLKGCDMVKQAEKDTARDICLKIIKDQPQPIKEKWVEWFKKEYGVEVER